jgi:transcriptional regulator of NAD metabolism
MVNRGYFVTRNFVIHTAYLVKSKNNVAGCVANMEEINLITNPNPVYSHILSHDTI